MREQSTDLSTTMAPRARNDEQKEKDRVGAQTHRDKMIEVAKAKKERAQQSQKKHTENVKLQKEQRERREAASMEEEDELSPAPMQTPVARRRYHHQQKQVVRGQNVAAAYERSLERDHETYLQMNATADNAMALAQYSMEKVAQGRTESSVREKDFRALLSSGTDHPPAFGNHQ